MKFYDLHPLSLIIYFISVIFPIMLNDNPIILIIALLGSILSLKASAEKINYSMYIFLFLIISLTNPLFSHNGETVLFYLFDQRITFEALIYGISTGCMITGVMLWFALFTHVFTQDKLSWLIGSLSPKLSVIFCMSLRFVPLFKKNAAAIYNAQKALGIFQLRTIKGKLLLCTNVFSALVSISMENAIETADTMRLRGFGEGKVTQYSLISYTKKDIIFTIINLIIDSGIILLTVLHEGQFVYYPHIVFGETTKFTVLFYLLNILLFLLPVLYNILEELKWKYLISKI